MNCQSRLCSGQGDSIRHIFQRQQRSPAQTAIDLRKEPVFYGIELGAIRMIINNKKPDILFVDKIHKLLLDDFILAGVGSSSVTKDNKHSGIRVLNFQMVLPDPLDIVTNESGSVVAAPHRHISHVFGDIIDTVRNNHSIAECGEIMVESLEASIGQSLAIPFEVSQHLFLLRVNADDGKSYGLRRLSDGRYSFELFVSVLDFLHGKILIEVPLPKSKGIKDLTNI